VTNDLQRRVDEHRTGSDPTTFTARYRLNRLVYIEATNDIRAAIAREKQIKGWLRRKKIALIEEMNPTCRDPSVEWRGASSLDAQNDEGVSSHRR
jgi:putative endonuclease